MRHFVQYHNPDRFGPPQIPEKDGPFWVMTSKRPGSLPGNCIWLIGGEGRPRRYFLRKIFVVDEWQPAQDPDFFYRLIGLRGVQFQPPIEVTGYPWFDEMKHRLASFSLGLTEITHTYARYLISLAHDLSPGYRQAEEAGLFPPAPGGD